MIIYAVLLFMTPFVSYDQKTRTLMSVSQLIIQYRPLSRFVAGGATWLLFLVLQNRDKTPLPYCCWLAAHGIVCFDADMNLMTHISFLVLFICLTLGIAFQSQSPTAIALSAVSCAFLLLLGLNLYVFKWSRANEQNFVELIWLGILCVWLCIPS